MAESNTSSSSSAVSLADLFTRIANAIRGKKGTSAEIPATDFPASIQALPVLDTSDATAVAANILSGKTAYAKGAKLTGSIASKTASDLTASGATVTVPAGYYASQATKSVATATQATPSVSVDAAGKITASAAQAAGYVSAGTKSATQQMTTQAAKTVTPSTSEQTAVASGVYTTGAVKVAAMPTATQATPSISVDTAGKITASAAQEAGYVSAGTKSATKQLTTQAAKTVAPSTSEQTAVASGVYTTGAVKVAAMPTATQATPSISVNSAGKITASATQTAGYVSAGTKSATQQLTTQGAQTITPGTTAKTAVAAGRYTTGAVTVQGDSRLVPDNIRSGVSIFGVYGNVKPYNEDTGWGVCELDCLDYEYHPLNTDRKSITVTLPDSAMKPFFITGSAFDAANKEYRFLCIKNRVQNGNSYFFVHGVDYELKDIRIDDSDDTYTIPIADTPISIAAGQLEFDFTVYYMYDQ